MGNKDVRRLCGNAFRMLRALCSIAIGLGTLLALSSDAWATRGRVKVADQTIVTDWGTLIRGARVSLDIWDETPSQADIDFIKSHGLNAVHIYAEYAGSNQAGGYNATKVDNVVDLADKNDLYVVLTIGCGGANGSFNQNFVTQFWNFYAPRYKDRTHVVYELMNEPQAWSAPYNTATLAMEKNGYTQIRGLAPDTHIMMMSYSQPLNWAQAATQCADLGISWDNASVAFHTYGIDGKEDSVLTSFYAALKAKGIVASCTEPNLTLKAITTKLFERDGISQTHFISAKDMASNSSSFTTWITSNNICWTPDFGTWPCGTAFTGARDGGSGTGGHVGTGGSTSTGGRGGDAGVGGASGTGGISGSGGAPSGSGGSSSAGGASAATEGGAGGRPVGSLGGSPSGEAAAGNNASNGCGCTVGRGQGRNGRGTEGGIALLLGLAFIRRLPARRVLGRRSPRRRPGRIKRVLY